ncbi:hypothetical protein BDQ94DRAFT_153890 [Aspergillus welwitschiae]|uniref:Uncharacterized protein n=1 Tax=Aspergillus welwitschiae TaxID=1341132 RepID=A0A3F3PKL7_9EURO|nr:hypothetical protein BDQ94DRAFT_153890 [Aspergillus welwitschiae]RDH27457.1 hypothetical protein BDQ94DRAFT_153890 [Aspergillus welwitschiae]
MTTLCFAFIVYLVVTGYGSDFLLHGLRCFMGLREFEGSDGVSGPYSCFKQRSTCKHLT